MNFNKAKNEIKNWETCTFRISKGNIRLLKTLVSISEVHLLIQLLVKIMPTQKQKIIHEKTG